MDTLTKSDAEPDAERPAPARRRPKTLTSPRPNTMAAVAVIFAMIGFGLWSLAYLKINIATLVDSVDNAADFLSRTVPLDFPPLAELAPVVAQTLAIVISATLLSVLISVPLAFWAAGNTTHNRATRLSSRGLVVCARAIPDVVLAIIFVRVFGLGILPGVLAMGIHSVGMVGKMYADAIEQIDEGPRTAIRATGARRLQQLVSGVLPQVAPSFVANAMHRLDINLRISVLLGYVGVSGIGKEMKNALSTLNYPRGIALAVVILALIVAMELISGMVRSAIMGRQVQPTRGGPVWLAKLIAAKLRDRRDAAAAGAPAQAALMPTHAAADKPRPRV
ncbi:MAG: phosphonate ABC transporter, permease protein PhnE, partial [Stackebrandtia sp.]